MHFRWHQMSAVEPRKRSASSLTDSGVKTPPALNRFFRTLDVRARTKAERLRDSSKPSTSVSKSSDDGEVNSEVGETTSIGPDAYRALLESVQGRRKARLGVSKCDAPNDGPLPKPTSADAETTSAVEQSPRTCFDTHEPVESCEGSEESSHSSNVGMQSVAEI
jgi:hypothetical protein